MIFRGLFQPVFQDFTKKKSRAQMLWSRPGIPPLRSTQIPTLHQHCNKLLCSKLPSCSSIEDTTSDPQSHHLKLNFKQTIKSPEKNKPDLPNYSKENIPKSTKSLHPQFFHTGKEGLSSVIQGGCESFTF